MHKITPEYLTQSVNFFDNNKDWKYSVDEAFSIPKIQAEGAAKLWNLLLDKKTALLADEVGMGKTIQGLAVMTVLWKQKANAKVLLYAPNENVARKWIREYDNFIRYHYRAEDNLVKSSMHGVPLRKAIYCSNHLELMEAVQAKWYSFIVCKTSSLSGFLSAKLTDEVIAELGINLPARPNEKIAKDDDVAKWMYLFGKKCNEKAYEILGNRNLGITPFDLIIFDEAHYLRRSEGHSNRSIAAHAFFSRRDIRAANPWDQFAPLADMTLLLTATPNHSSSNDIVNIVSLFNPRFRNKKPLEILQDICVRRFRRLEGKSKHAYRHETAESVEMKHIRERLFFAAYHKSLVKAKADLYKKDKGKKNTDNPYRILFGYLEGFEFLPQSNGTVLPKNNKVDGPDFHERDDRKVIVQLSEQYKKIYKTHPEHPKYRRILEELKPCAENNFCPEKKLVFVRRIASVYEISSRVICEYDDIFIESLKKGFNKNEAKKINRNIRGFFWELARGEKEDFDVTVGKEDVQSPADKISHIESKAMSLFTKKKDGKYQTTDCYNFRNRFLKKEQIFSLFFEPASDYFSDGYTFTSVLQNTQNKRQFKLTAQKKRIETISENEQSRLTLSQHFDIENIENVPNRNIDFRFETLLSIWLKNEIIDTNLFVTISAARVHYYTFSVNEKEGFSQYLEKGLLFASQFIIKFYHFYRVILRQSNLRGEDLYLAFCKAVKESMEENGLCLLIANAVLTFQRYYKKELGETPETIYKANWSFLTNTLPVYPYCGETKRGSIIKAFNSPFYPDVLVATSVLQEGVDLHYHCNEVIHYGIAWTQGDNEQRVGRVDRMFGKMESNLKKDATSTLRIHYPFLKNTIDQDQVARFILRKHQSEKLLDQLKIVNSGSEINFREQITEEMWSKCFNKPGENEIEGDPFPVNSSDFGQVKLMNNGDDISTKTSEFITPLFNSIKRHFTTDFVVFNNGSDNAGDDRIFALKHIRPNTRHQPIVGRFGYSEEGLYLLNKPVYYLRLTTPIAKNRRNIDTIYRYSLMKNIYKDNPMLKICLDQTQKDYFRYYVCADLPLFICDDSSYNLSAKEIIETIESMISFSDDLEQIIHGVKFDIPNENVIEHKHEEWQMNGVEFLGEDRDTVAGRNWIQTTAGKHIYREKSSYSLDYDANYIFNHEQFFLRKVNLKTEAKIQGGIYKKDALEEECKFLSLIIDTVT